MNSDIDSNPTFKINDVLPRVISLYKNNLSLFIGISALGAIPVLLVILSPKNLGLVLFPVSFFIGIWAYAALVVAASKKYHNETVTIIECFASVRGKYWRVIGVGAICYLILLAGLLLFIIPGIYWGTVFGLSCLVVIIDGRKETGPFKLSNELIKRFFWKTFWFSAIISIPFLLPLIPALTLNKANPKLAIFLVNIFQAVVMPFYIMGEVLLYHKLSEIKVTDLSRSPEVINKSRYGCLCAVGLIIAIIILSGIWISQIGRFIHSETGYAIAQNVIKKISPPITFPDGVTLDRPSERLVLQKTAPRLGYTLFHFKRQKDQTMAVKLYSYSLKDLGLEGKAVDLSNQDIAKKIRYKNIDKYEFVMKSWERKHGIFEIKSIKLINLNNRSWGECILVASNPASSTKKQGYVWKIYYTPVKDNMLIADFGYTFNIGKTQEPEIPTGELAKEEKMAIDIIKSIKFPEQGK